MCLVNEYGAALFSDDGAAASRSVVGLLMRTWEASFLRAFASVEVSFVGQSIGFAPGLAGLLSYLDQYTAKAVHQRVEGDKPGFEYLVSHTG